MAWFGDGFSSLKGQITNFTKDIVANNVVGLGPYTLESSEETSSRSEDGEKTHLERLKLQCQHLDEEITRLREDNEKLRKQAARQTPRDRRISEEVTLECGEDLPTTAPLPLVPLDDDGTDSFIGQDHIPKDVKVEDEVSSLRSRLRKTFQEKVLMEQNCSRLEKEVALLTRQVTEDRQQAQANAEAVCKNCHQGTQTELTTLPTTSTASQDSSSLAHENHQLKQERAQLRTELARMSRAVQELESQVAVSQDENANLSTGMEELDIQHQEAIEQIMVLKDSTQKRYEILQAEFEDMKQKFEELKKSKDNDKCLTDSECQTNNEVCSEAKSQVLIDLSEEIKNMITTDIPDKYFETSKESANVLETVTAIEKMLSHTMARVDSSESKIRDLLKELRNRDDEVQEIEEENKTLHMKIDELNEQLVNLPTISENNEDVEEAMENKIMSLESEVAVLREVRSNLEVELRGSRSEIENLIRQLQSANAKNGNQDNLQTEILKYRENEQELLKKIAQENMLKEEIMSELSCLRKKIDEQDKFIVDLNQSKQKLDEISVLNDQLQEELSKSKESESKYLKLLEELEIEKSLRLQLEQEKEKMFCEITKLESVEENSMKQNLEFKKELDRRLQLEEENTELKLKIETLEDLNKEHDKVIEMLQTETNLKKQLEESMEIMHAEIQRLEKEDELHKQQLEQQHRESELKAKELKALNSGFSQKCVKLEKELFEVSEKLDCLKIEMDLKDRKLCEILLEKSLSDKELQETKNIKDSLEKELFETKEQFSKTENVFIQNLSDTLNKFSNIGIKMDITSITGLKSTLEEVVSRFVFLDQEKNMISKENENLSESVKSLISEVSDKTDCLIKINAQMETMQAEKHSLEDRLRNIKDTVSTGNQTDQSDGPEVTRESFNEVCKKLEESAKKNGELEEKFNKLLMSSEQSLNHVNEQLRNLHSERQQLIETVQTKHSECLKYHAEIQRLCSELAKSEHQRTALSTQLTKEVQEKESQLSVLQASSDRQVGALTQQVHTLQNQLDYVSQLLRVTDRQEAEGQPASDTPAPKGKSSKTEVDEKEARRVEELYESLQQEQLRNKYLQDEVSEQHEKEASLMRELERLRSHLVAVEDNYTAEMLRAEQHTQELTQRLAVAEDRAKSSSTAYTSASIRANQQVESLSVQMRQMSEQKEKLASQLASAEDRLHKQAAALTNLQIVLDQFQRDKERDVAIENERIRQTLQHANAKNLELANEIKALQTQLKEAKEGLSAASRLTEQLDHKSQTITELKQEVAELTSKLKKAEERIQAASVSVEGKVDRCLVRNLVVGYLSAPPTSRQQALNIVATVLDFSQDDRQKSGLDPNAKFSGSKQQSLSEAFVQFLENESRPQPHLRLTLQESEGSRSRKTSVTEVGLPPARRTSGSVLKDVLKQDI